jgi:hypothetical protein
MSTANQQLEKKMRETTVCSMRLSLVETSNSVAKTFPRKRMANSPTIVWFANMTGLASIFGGNQNEEQIWVRLTTKLERLVESSNPEFKELLVHIMSTLEGSITMDLQKLNTSLISAAGDGNLQ